MADEGSVSYPRIRTAVLAGALLSCLSACSNSYIRPGGRVSTADLRAGKLAVAVEACVTGVVTNYDQDLGTLVVQDRTGAFKFGEVPRPGARFGQQTEVCGETRPAQSGMTLARPSVKALRDADLPVPRPTSPEEWSTGRVDWQWIEVEGLAHAVTADRFGVKTLHVLVQDRRVRVRIAATEGLQSVSNMVGARVRAIGIASQTSSHAGGEDFLLLSPGTRFVTEVSPAAPVATLPIVTVAEAVKMAGSFPDRRVRLRGSVVAKGAGREPWFRDTTGELRLASQERTFPETDDTEIAAFPVRTGQAAVELVGPLSTRLETPVTHERCWRAGQHPVRPWGIFGSTTAAERAIAGHVERRPCGSHRAHRRSARRRAVGVPAAAGVG